MPWEFNHLSHFSVTECWSKASSKESERWKGFQKVIFKRFSPQISCGQPVALSAYQEYFYLLKDFFTLLELACDAPGRVPVCVTVWCLWILTANFRIVAQNPMFQNWFEPKSGQKLWFISLKDSLGPVAERSWPKGVPPCPAPCGRGLLYNDGMFRNE